VKRETALTHEFVEYFPDKLKDGTIYVSIPFATAVHKCCCGCGNQVVTPLSPTDWKLIFDGRSITLDPSIGNWNFPCQSHYWIRCNSVKWVPRRPQKKILMGRAHEALKKTTYFDNTGIPADNDEITNIISINSFWHKIKRWLR
jgi:hypothetical protein